MHDRLIRRLLHKLDQMILRPSMGELLEDLQREQPRLSEPELLFVCATALGLFSMELAEDVQIDLHTAAVYPLFHIHEDRKCQLSLQDLSASSLHT